ncbi:hypothetical protein [Streptomyces luteogriseus]|uniref:hypothetical protein n=1 Tax=Streptomyces luteogriseus TaxID=68233 RepID=UPI0037BC9460
MNAPGGMAVADTPRASRVAEAGDAAAGIGGGITVPAPRPGTRSGTGRTYVYAVKWPVTRVRHREGESAAVCAFARALTCRGVSLGVARVVA